jgi:hypothetical protein
VSRFQPLPEHLAVDALRGSVAAGDRGTVWQVLKQARPAELRQLAMELLYTEWPTPVEALEARHRPVCEPVRLNPRRC